MTFFQFKHLKHILYIGNIEKVLLVRQINWTHINNIKIENQFTAWTLQKYYSNKHNELKHSISHKVRFWKKN